MKMPANKPMLLWQCRSFEAMPNGSCTGIQNAQQPITRTCIGRSFCTVTLLSGRSTRLEQSDIKQTKRPTHEIVLAINSKIKHECNSKETLKLLTET